jgi:hypothetical protein
VAGFDPIIPGRFCLIADIGASLAAPMGGAASELPQTVQNRAWLSWRLPHWEQNKLASLKSDGPIAASGGSGRGPVQCHKHQTPLGPEDYAQPLPGQVACPYRRGWPYPVAEEGRPITWLWAVLLPGR